MTRRRTKEEIQVCMREDADAQIAFDCWVLHALEYGDSPGSDRDLLDTLRHCREHYETTLIEEEPEGLDQERTA